ncbi:protein FAM47E [Sarcophilus harrisii]|uniref:Family with sequence similarity 47 member E n=1 Tax=Sarcophilus harrisii TaxID=9305 RepID=G3VDJ2_SARHA|nr:protein FAM47E [Sarcophilus harrisii]
MSERDVSEVQSLCSLHQAKNIEPWYKERLPSKCFRSTQRRLKCPDALNSHRWIFLKSGMDDFRKGGVPPCKDMMTQRPKEPFLPLIYHKKGHSVQKQQPKSMELSELFSKLSPTQKLHKENADKLEYFLAQHPLALYPNLEESLPVELLAQVLKILDPKKCLEDEWAYCQEGRQLDRKPWTGMLKVRECLPLEGPKPPPVKNPYRFFRGEEKAEEEEFSYFPALEDHIRRTAKEFCDWVSDFGENDKMDVATIMKLFETSYECPKTYNVLHLMKMNQVPLDLKKGVELTRLQEMRYSLEEIDHERKTKRTKNPYKPEWVKFSYGAWYLHTNLWKKRRANEPLLDPKLEATSKYEKLKKNLLEKDATLLDLHATVAFKEFIERKGYRMPTFLSRLFKKDDKNSPENNRKLSPQPSQLLLQLKAKKRIQSGS